LFKYLCIYSTIYGSIQLFIDPFNYLWILFKYLSNVGAIEIIRDPF